MGSVSVFQATTTYTRLAILIERLGVIPGFWSSFLHLDTSKASIWQCIECVAYVMRVRCSSHASAPGPYNSLHSRYLHFLVLVFGDSTFTLVLPLRSTGLSDFRHKRVPYIVFRIHSVSMKLQRSANQQLLTISQPRHGRTERGRALSAFPPLAEPNRERSDCIARQYCRPIHHKPRR